MRIYYLRNCLFAALGIGWLACSNTPTSRKTADSVDTIATPEGYQLVWHDEFNGTELDRNKWEYEVNAQGGGNNELQYYTDRPQNSFVKDGVLTIQALKETYTGAEGTREYTSARLKTINRGDWKYGWFELRARLPYGKGLWPALWMMPTDQVYGGWAASGEIDIVELLGHEPNKIYGTLHYGGSYPNNVHTGSSYTLTNGNFATSYHIFTLIWEANAMRWLVDGHLYQTQTQWYTSGQAFPAPFDQRFYLILNVAVGGNWPGNPDNTTSFPQRLDVDYVRVFQKPE